jgi:pantoate--beta-alanine ligase
VDYVSVRSRSTLLAPEPDETQKVILAAARLGRTRLIDNIEC